MNRFILSNVWEKDAEILGDETLNPRELIRAMDRPSKMENEPMQIHYNVDYEFEGERHTETGIWCSNPGAAMADCLKSHPGAKIIRAWKEGYGGKNFGYGFQEWLPPKVQREPQKEPRPARALRRNERGCEFPFYDQVQSVPADGKRSVRRALK